MSPTSANRFGLELEFPKYMGTYFNHKDWEDFVFKASQDLAVKFDVSPDEHIYKWTVKSDSSAGIEITSPALFCNFQSFKMLDLFLTNLEKEIFQDETLSYKDFESKENGLHVHLSQSCFSSKEHLNAFFRFFLVFEKTIFSMFPQYRKKNQYAESLKSVLGSDYRDLMAIDFVSDPRFSDHYACVNLNAEHQTVEIRHSQGTLNSRHILGWLSFILLVVDACPLVKWTPVDHIRNLKQMFFKCGFYSWKTDLLRYAFTWLKK
jgi:hypothetical protein